MEAEPTAADAMNVIPEELMEGSVDISTDQDGGVKKVHAQHF